MGNVTMLLKIREKINYFFKPSFTIVDIPSVYKMLVCLYVYMSSPLTNFKNHIILLIA